MQINEILSRVDHTLLSPTASWDEIKEIVDDGIAYKTASVCIPASYVKRASDYARGRVRICTVIGFPNGYDTTAAKEFMARDAIANGADEIDMVIDLGWVKNGERALLLDEIKRIKAACGGHILKVIIECCRLTDAEKRMMCHIVSESGADFIKTSTGFGGGGATREDVALMASECAPHVKIKAAGGIRTLADAEDYIALGASRLGTSSIVKLIKNASSGK